MKVGVIRERMMKKSLKPPIFTGLTVRMKVF